MNETAIRHLVHCLWFVFIDGADSVYFSQTLKKAAINRRRGLLDFAFRAKMDFIVEDYQPVGRFR